MKVWFRAKREPFTKSQKRERNSKNNLFLDFTPKNNTPSHCIYHEQRFQSECDKNSNLHLPFTTGLPTIHLHLLSAHASLSLSLTLSSSLFFIFPDQRSFSNFFISLPPFPSSHFHFHFLRVHSNHMFPPPT